MPRRKRQTDFESDELLQAAADLGAVEENDLLTADDLAVSDTAQRVIDYAPRDRKVGDGMIVSVKLPIETVRMMDAIIHMPGSPFEGQRSDFLRDAVYFFSKVFKYHLEIDYAPLIEALNHEMMVRKLEESKRRFTDIHDDAISLRANLCRFMDDDDVAGAMHELGQFYERVERMQVEGRARYERVLREMPVAQLVAWHCKFWDDNNLPASLLPERDPTPKRFVVNEWMGDEGVPPTLQEWSDGKRRGK